MAELRIEQAIVSAITLPLVLTIPSLYVLLVHYRSLPRGTSRWIYGSLAVAFVDALLLVALTSVAFGTWC